MIFSFSAALETKNAESSSEKDLSVLEQYWKAVRDNPSDFTGWTYLLQYVEQEVCLNHDFIIMSMVYLCRELSYYLLLFASESIMTH